ncbi:hypothetical protein KGP93_05475, partial [Burkholderia multivorans]|nr:hypothetical protein [Burkholderia multivorans]
ITICLITSYAPVRENRKAGVGAPARHVGLPAARASRIARDPRPAQADSKPTKLAAYEVRARAAMRRDGRAVRSSAGMPIARDGAASRCCANGMRARINGRPAPLHVARTSNRRYRRSLTFHFSQIATLRQSDPSNFHPYPIQQEIITATFE